MLCFFFFFFFSVPAFCCDNYLREIKKISNIICRENEYIRMNEGRRARFADGSVVNIFIRTVKG